MPVRGMRKATTVSENNKELILVGARECLLALQNTYHIETQDIVNIFFNMTSDLNAAFPAAAARQLGWNNVLLFGMQESNLSDGLARCIKILILVNTDKSQDKVRHF